MTQQFGIVVALAILAALCIVGAVWSLPRRLLLAFALLALSVGAFGSALSVGLACAHAALN